MTQNPTTEAGRPEPLTNDELDSLRRAAANPSSAVHPFTVYELRLISRFLATLDARAAAPAGLAEWLDELRGDNVREWKARVRAALEPVR